MNLNSLPEDIIEDSSSDELILTDRNEVNNMITELYKAKQPNPQPVTKDSTLSPTKEDTLKQNTDSQQQPDAQKAIKKRRMIENELFSSDSKRSGSRRSTNDLVKSSIDFNCFACDTQMKEVIN